MTAAVHVIFVRGAPPKRKSVQLQLDRRWIDKLARLPESGMGYQRVRVRLRAGRTIEDALVFNASVLQVADDTAPFASEDISDIEPARESGR